MELTILHVINAIFITISYGEGFDFIGGADYLVERCDRYY